MKSIFYLLIAMSTLTFSMSSCNNKCASINCENGGKCSDGVCSCENGYSGETCQIEDKCITGNITCYNGGACVSSTGDCNCSTFYTGKSCLDELRSKYYGNYIGTYISGSFSSDNAEWLVGSYLTSPTRFKLTINSARVLYATMITANTYEVTSDNSSSFSYTGSGTITTTSLSFTGSYSNSSGTRYSVRFNGTR